MRGFLAMADMQQQGVHPKKSSVIINLLAYVIQKLFWTGIDSSKDGEGAKLSEQLFPLFDVKGTELFSCCQLGDKCGGDVQPFGD